MKKYYHATTIYNLGSILDKGLTTEQSCDKVIYLCETPIDACKFLYVRGIREIYVIEVLLDENEVQESYDHNEKFFGCKAYTYGKDIKNIELNQIKKYEF